MRRKSVFAVVAIVLATAGLVISQTEGSKKVAVASSDTVAVQPDSTAQKVDSAASHTVVAYYFHTTQRCASCKKIEAYSDEAIRTGFESALKDGKLEWRVINVDEPENQHFIQDYQLYTKSLVLTDVAGGKQVRWKNLDQIWKLLGDKDAFVVYVKDEVKGYIGGN